MTYSAHNVFWMTAAERNQYIVSPSVAELAADQGSPATVARVTREDDN